MLYVILLKPNYITVFLSKGFKFVAVVLIASELNHTNFRTTCLTIAKFLTK